MTTIRWLLPILALLSAAPVVQAQLPQESGAQTLARLARRGGGLRAGAWNVEKPAADTTFDRSPLLEVYFQRGLDPHLAVESSATVWWATTFETQASTGNLVQTRSFLVPVMTGLKAYPITTASDLIEPYVLGAVGFTLGIEMEGKNAIGGGGTSIFTGFAFKGGTGLELHLGRTFGLNAGLRYQWVRFAKEMAGLKIFRGAGLEGGITYRLQ